MKVLYYYYYYYYYYHYYYYYYYCYEDGVPLTALSYGDDDCVPLTGGGHYGSICSTLTTTDANSRSRPEPSCPSLFVPGKARVDGVYTGRRCCQR